MGAWKGIREKLAAAGGVSGAPGVGEHLQVSSHVSPVPRRRLAQAPRFLSAAGGLEEPSLLPSVWTAYLRTFGAGPPVCSPSSNCPEISITAMQMTDAGGWATHSCQGSSRLSDDSLPWAVGAGAASCATHHCPLLDAGTSL